MDQSHRCPDLSPQESQLIAGSTHLLCAYFMKPKARLAYLRVAAHVAAESSTGTNVAGGQHQVLARADFALVGFGPDANTLAFLVDGYVGGPGMVTTARRT